MVRDNNKMEGKGNDKSSSSSSGPGPGPGPCLSKYVDPSSEESHRYYLARRNALEMLRDRGYEVSLEDINLSLQDFRTVYGEHPDVDRLRISAHLRSDSSNKVNIKSFRFAFFFFAISRGFCFFSLHVKGLQRCELYLRIEALCATFVDSDDPIIGFLGVWSYYGMVMHVTVSILMKLILDDTYQVVL